jgi:hypothetical protein
MTLKKLIYNLLVSNPLYRNSDRQLIWKVYSLKGYTSGDSMTKESFMKAPSPESIRRCRQALQRSDKLTGENLIQPNKETYYFRSTEAKLDGYNFIQGQFV